jgi:hypothetical protein
MTETFPNVYKTHETTPGKNFGWGGVLTDIAGPKYGTDEELQKRNVWNLLFIMEKNEVRRKEAEREKK